MPKTDIGANPNNIAPSAVPVIWEQLPVTEGIFNEDITNINAPDIASNVIFFLSCFNIFSMAIAGPFLSYILFQFCKKCNINKKMSIFIAAFLGDLFTYCITSIQLAFAYPSMLGGISASIIKFLGVFAPTQLPLAIIEGILTVMIMIVLETYAIPEMKLIGLINEEVQYEQKK